MAMPVPQKIVLKSSTSISLNDRFTMIGKQQRIPPSAQTVRVQMAAQQQASAKNQRLALQMANRPSVQAALGSQDQGSVLERLGNPSVMSRLGVPRGRGRGRSRSWRGRGGMRGGRPGGGRGGMIDNREMINTYQFQPGVLGHGRGMARGQGGPGRGRGRDFSVFRGRGRSFRGRSLSRGRGGRSLSNFDYRGRGSRGSWSRQRGRGRGASGNPPTREYLDNQLDEYMARQPGDVSMVSDK